MTYGPAEPLQRPRPGGTMKQEGTLKVSNDQLRALIRQRLPVGVILQKTKMDERSLSNRCRALRIDFAKYKYDSDRGFSAPKVGQVVSKSTPAPTLEQVRDKDRVRGDMAGISTLARNGYTVAQIAERTGQDEVAVVLVGHRHGIQFEGMSSEEMDAIVTRHAEFLESERQKSAERYAAEQARAPEKPVAEHLRDEEQRLLAAYKELPGKILAIISRRHAGIERWCSKNMAGKETMQRMKDNARKEETRKHIRDRDLIDQHKAQQ